MQTFIEKLRALSDKQKLAIIVVAVVIAVIVMGFFWIKSASNSISKIGQSASAIPLPNITVPGLSNN